jgi:hypothetical protein
VTCGSSVTDHASRSSGDSSVRCSGGLGLTDLDVAPRGERSKAASGGSLRRGRKTRDVVREWKSTAGRQEKRRKTTRRLLRRQLGAAREERRC